MRFLITDHEGKIFFGAQLHILEDRWLRDENGVLQVATDCYVKKPIFFAEEGVPHCNPMIMDANGISPSFILEKPQTDKKKK